MFSLVTIMFAGLVASASASDFTQITPDPFSRGVYFLDNSTVFARTEYHAGVWNTKGESIATFQSNQAYPPTGAARVQCGYIANFADWSVAGAAVDLYDQKTYKLYRTLRPAGTTDPANMIWSMDFSGDCSKMLIALWPADDAKPLHFYLMDVETGNVLDHWDLGTNFGYIEAALLNKDGSKMLVYHEQGAGVYDLGTKALTWIYYDPTYVDYYPRFSTDGKYVLKIDHYEGSVDRYNIATGEWKNLAKVSGELDNHFAFHPTDPNRFFVFGDEVLQVDVERGTLMHFGLPRKMPGYLNTICASKDLVMVAEPGFSRIYEIESGALRTELTDLGDSKVANSCAISDDGKFALTGTDLGARLFPISP